MPDSTAKCLLNSGSLVPWALPLGASSSTQPPSQFRLFLTSHLNDPWYSFTSGCYSCRVDLCMKESQHDLSCTHSISKLWHISSHRERWADSEESFSSTHSDTKYRSQPAVTAAESQLLDKQEAFSKAAQDSLPTKQIVISSQFILQQQRFNYWVTSMDHFKVHKKKIHWGPRILWVSF